MSRAQGALLHFFPASFEDWRHKFERRVFDVAYFASLNDHNRAQYGSYLEAQEQGGEAGLRRLFERLSVISVGRAKEMIEAGTAFATGLDLDHLGSATFKPLRPARFTHVRRAAWRPPGPRIFQIGMNRSGLREICEHFAARGFSYAHWDGGNLARDLLRAKEQGRRPFAPYDRVHLLSGMSLDSTGLYHDGARDVMFIAEHFPDAVYLFNHRPVDEWIASLARICGGAYIEEQRLYFQLRSGAEVKAKWHKDWEAHVANVRQLQRDGLRVLEWKVNTDKPYLVFKRLETLLGEHPAWAGSLR